MKRREFEERLTSANGWRHKSALNPAVIERPNKYHFVELKLGVEILDMELRADGLTFIWWTHFGI